MAEPPSIIDVRQVGTITEIKRGIVKLQGLPGCVMGQLVELGPLTQGLVVGFTDEDVSLLVLGAEAELSVGQRVAVHQQPWRLGVGEALMGRIVSALGEPLDGKPVPVTDTLLPVFHDAPSVMQRIPISRQLLTGIKMIDTMIPIGRGQRELIIGDRMTGKTSLALDTLLNQQGHGVVCIYCCVGQSHHKLAQSITLLNDRGALDYTIVVAATASQVASEQFLAPYAACTIGEFFMQRGRDVLVIFDDLSKHAWAYRQLSLLLERSPGREAYPGDMFFIHAQFMERAGQLREELGGGSMTFLPICETQQGDVTGYIPSNLISMTDGQLYLSSDLFYEGFKPAVDLGLSVSRIGNKVQSPALRQVSGSLRLEALQYRELKRLGQFATHTAAALADRVRHGELLRRLLVQPVHQPMPIEEQIVLFYSFQRGWLERLTEEGMALFQMGIVAKLPQTVQDLIRSGEPLTAAARASLDAALQTLVGPYLQASGDSPAPPVRHGRQPGRAAVVQGGPGKPVELFTQKAPHAIPEATQR